MIFLVWNENTPCAARWTGRTLAEQAGLRGVALVERARSRGVFEVFRGPVRR